MKLKTLALSFQVALSTLAISSLLSACKSEEPAQSGGYPQQGQPAGLSLIHI